MQDLQQIFNRVQENKKKLKDLKAIIVETSFPDRFEELAEVSGHLTPRSLQRELNKILCRDIPIMIFHQKPAFIDEIKKEIAKIKKWNIIVLEQSTTYDL